MVPAELLKKVERFRRRGRRPQALREALAQGLACTCAASVRVPPFRVAEMVAEWQRLT
jgi:hypothetical protein